MRREPVQHVMGLPIHRVSVFRLEIPCAIVVGEHEIAFSDNKFARMLPLFERCDVQV
ncbi:hypothetical protein [Saccharopolyspora sp. NPDC050642]|uniref:hypothetical protein n=1 Tax=Saccharopolyspora sp. NPDC050642 TaxID=3157099 RepID=UPI00340EF88B